MACVLITDVPIVEALEGQNEKDFEALWDILKTGKIRGYITPNDLQQLEQYLYEFVGETYAQKLLAGFRSVLDIYGDPDHPTVDLIIDSESVDELVDEIPIRSVSDFLCIYELELLWLMEPGEEILADSLFSSISDIIEVLDGDDAFVSKALMDAIVPVEDAPLLENLARHSFTEGRAIASHTVEDEAASLANDIPVEEQPLNSHAPSRTLPLSPVMQAILDSGMPAGQTKYDLRFGFERPDQPERFKHRMMALAHMNQSTYNFNVDMFLILGLIMQMVPQNNLGEAENLNVHRTLLTRKPSPSPTHRSNLDSQTIASAALNSRSLQAAPEDSPKFPELFWTDLAPLQQNRARPLFNSRDSDRPLTLNFFAGNPYSKKTAATKTDSESRSISTTVPSAVSDHPPQPIGISKSPHEQPLSQLRQDSTQLIASHKSQISPFRQPAETTLVSVPGASDKQMESMLSGGWRSLTSRMGDYKITITSHSDNPGKIVDSQGLTRLLKSLQETQSRGDRLSSQIPFSQKRSLVSAHLKQSNKLSGLAPDQSTIRRPAELSSFSNLFPSSSDPSNGNNADAGESRVSSGTSALNSVPNDTDNSVESEALEPEQLVDMEQNYFLTGSAGKDEFVESGGSNSIDSYGGRDSINVRNGSYSINAGDGGDWVEAQGGRTNISSGTGADSIIVSDGSYHAIYAGGGADSMMASNTRVTMQGGGGNDAIYVSEVAYARIHGGSGADIIEVSSTKKKVAEIFAGSGADKISVADGTYSIRASHGRDEIKLQGVTNSRIYSGNGNDLIELDDATDSHIYSGNGNDEIYVSGENTTIYARQGDDLVGVYSGVSTLTGGMGEDIFVLFRDESFDHKNVKTDSHHIVVTDFEQGQDTLGLHDTTLDALSLKQVGADTHIFDGDDLLAVLNSINTGELSTAEITAESLRFGDVSPRDLSPTVLISWDSTVTF